jgi:hypothetical protein
MIRRLALVAAMCLVFASAPILDAKGSSSKGSSGSSTNGKTVHVKEYTRKDGTTVKAHDRKAPERKAATTETKSAAFDTQLSAHSATAVTRDADGHIKRSAAAKGEFMRQTGFPRGRPGYVVDHIVPLACGGADAPSNLQWQTITEARAKDKTERIGCGRYVAPTTSGFAMPLTNMPSVSATTTSLTPPLDALPAGTSRPSATSTLAGLTEGQVRSRFGMPSSTGSGVWYFDRPAGTLRVYFDHGMVSSTAPADFDLESVTPKPETPQVPASPPPPPWGAIARCGDGSYVLAVHKNGTCFGHGGVAQRLQ